MSDHDSIINSLPCLGAVENPMANTPDTVDLTPPDHDGGMAEKPARKNESAWQWIKRQQLKIALGGVAVSTAVTFTNEFDKFQREVIESGPWVGSALAGGEIAWIGSAALMLAAVGSKVGNPMKIRNKIPEIVEKAVNNRAFKTGFAVNISASMLQTGVAVEAITQLPPESWGLLGIPALNLSSDILLVNAMRKRMRKNAAGAQQDVSKGQAQEFVEPDHESDRPPQVIVRKANLGDVERMAEIDLSRYKRVYGANPPSKAEVKNMFASCIENAGDGYTYVCEVDGVIEGLVNAFRTDKSMEDFVSWEDCTADGTLDGRVQPDGKYVYAANLTVNPKAMKVGGEDMLVANLLAQAIKDGAEYGYFISRMPLFSAWVRRQMRQGEIERDISPETLDELAVHYVNSKEMVDSKEVRLDHELRMYEGMGFELGRVVRDGFQDPQSMNYGVLCKVDVPPKGALKKIKITRSAMAGSLRMIAKHPKLLEKLFA